MVKCCGNFVPGGIPIYHTVCGHDLCALCWSRVGERCPTCRRHLIVTDPRLLAVAVTYGIKEITCFMCKVTTSYPFPIRESHNIIDTVNWREDNRFWYFENGYTCDTCVSTLIHYNTQSDSGAVENMLYTARHTPSAWDTELYAQWKWGSGEVSPFRMKRDLLSVSREVSIYRNIFRESSNSQFERVSLRLQEIEKNRLSDKTSIYNVVCNDIYMWKSIEYADIQMKKVLNELKIHYANESDRCQLNAVVAFLKKLK